MKLKTTKTQEEQFLRKKQEYELYLERQKKQIIFNIKDLQDHIFPIYDTWIDTWYNGEEIYLDESTGEVVSRIYRADEYTDAKHPQWEIKKVLFKGELK